MVYEKIQEYCDKHSITIRAFEEKCGLRNGTISNWKLRKNRPSLESLQAVSSASGISLRKWLNWWNEDYGKDN